MLANTWQISICFHPKLSESFANMNRLNLARPPPVLHANPKNFFHFYYLTGYLVKTMRLGSIWPSPFHKAEWRPRVAKRLSQSLSERCWCSNSERLWSPTLRLKPCPSLPLLGRSSSLSHCQESPSRKGMQTQPKV